MRVKSITVGMGYEDEVQEVYLVVPEHVSGKEVMRSIQTGEGHDCLCECWALQDADTIVSLWNEKFSDS